MKGLSLLKGALSIFLAYHLLAVIILPMGSGLLIRELGRYFMSYANQFGFNSTWQFFSPGPSPSFYLEYTYRSDTGDEELADAQLMPERRIGFGWSDFYNRRLYSMRFMALNPERTVRYLVPHLCALNPAAKSVSLRTLVEKVENVDRARLGSDTQDFNDLAVQTELPQGTHLCERGEP